MQSSPWSGLIASLQESIHMLEYEIKDSKSLASKSSHVEFREAYSTLLEVNMKLLDEAHVDLNATLAKHDDWLKQNTSTVLN